MPLHYYEEGGVVSIIMEYNRYTTKNMKEYFIEIKATQKVSDEDLIKFDTLEWRPVDRQDEPMSKRQAIAELKRSKVSMSARRGYIFRVRAVETKSRILNEV